MHRLGDLTELLSDLEHAHQTAVLPRLLGVQPSTDLTARIPASVLGPAAARVPMKRETVGPEATGPKRALGPQQEDIGQVVPAESGREREIQQDLPRIMYRLCAPPRHQSRNPDVERYGRMHGL